MLYSIIRAREAAILADGHGWTRYYFEYSEPHPSPRALSHTPARPLWFTSQPGWGAQYDRGGTHSYPMWQQTHTACYLLEATRRAHRLSHGDTRASDNFGYWRHAPQIIARLGRPVPTPPSPVYGATSDASEGDAEPTPDTPRSSPSTSCSSSDTLAADRHEVARWELERALSGQLEADLHFGAQREAAQTAQVEAHYLSEDPFP